MIRYCPMPPFILCSLTDMAMSVIGTGFDLAGVPFVGDLLGGLIDIFCEW